MKHNMIQDGMKKFILILEDSPTQAAQLEFILETEGYDSKITENGIEALEYLFNPANKKPDIIISDIVMPEMNGFEFCKNLKKEDRLKYIPIILLTSLSEPTDVIFGLECGADNFITKPYQKEYLLSRINYILANMVLRKNQTSDTGVNIRFGGKEYCIKSSKIQILDLLFSSFENAVQKNTELKNTIQVLKKTQKELILANEQTEAAKEKLNILATKDPLTNIYNRRAFRELGVKMFSLANREKKKIAVFQLDIDNFKSINDTLGHDTGDAVLKVIAARLTENLRKEDIIGRMGGDEFSVIIIGIRNNDKICTIANKLLESFANPIVVGDDKIYSTLSIGISITTPDVQNLYDCLLKEADLAMYAAKRNGKNKYKIFDKSIKVQYEKQISYEDELKRGIREKEFSMVYQPIVNLKNAEIVGVESLMRWNNKKLGSVTPAIFIPLAEKTKLIHDIGRWALDEVMKQYSDWKKQGIKECFVTFNISPVQFERKEFVPELIKHLKKYELDPKKVVMEITETAYSQFLTAENLIQMKNNNMLIAIDDFGSGYSSMQRLLELPIDYMKIDGNNILKLSKDEKYKDIICNILAIAKSLKVKTIAECVETKEQSDFLLNNNCEYAQGYRYYKPMPADEVFKLLK
jgi:diguanylate cyclase (GGDEF)-like protein